MVFCGILYCILNFQIFYYTFNYFFIKFNFYFKISEYGENIFSIFYTVLMHLVYFIKSFSFNYNTIFMGIYLNFLSKSLYYYYLIVQLFKILYLYLIVQVLESIIFIVFLLKKINFIFFFNYELEIYNFLGLNLLILIISFLTHIIFSI